MISTDIDLKASLQEYFGFSTFKDKQEKIIENILDGKDTFVLMPTGGGKSLCYQLPALVSPGLALVISPLIALMKNQVDAIRGYNKDNSVAHFLNSSLNKSDIKQVKSDIALGKTKLLYIAPETLTKQENIDFLKESNVSFVAVDEAHCISEWGHDFRPEYRKIRRMIEGINENIPIMALTATATPKVQTDIVKNLRMDDVKTFKSSFNRDNLFYEVRPKVNKDNAIKGIVKFIKKHSGKSGIIYVQSRKSTEEIAKVLQVNGINAAPYHAGLDGKTRSKIQDDFIMSDLDVICATIAFGMGIDKPDVRFVIHYDIPKSIENYYQETGRAGRDGQEGNCLTFYSYKDILKLEKFLRDKPVSERELGSQLKEEMIGYAEASTCRREFLLHYFGEQFDIEGCNKMCDNCKNPKELFEAKDEVKLALQAVEQLKENSKMKGLVDFVVGNNSKEVKDFKYDKLSLFGKGKEHKELFWTSLFRQILLANKIRKEIEQYGILKLTDEGKAFIKKPTSFKISINHDYSQLEQEETAESLNASSKTALDSNLLVMLEKLRKSQSVKHGVPPWVIFMDASLNDMATYYPISKEDMVSISGVNKGKADKYAGPFLSLIKEYVEENNIDRPTEFLMRQVANKSKSKVAIIQGVDKKLPLEDIASSSNMKLEELLEEMDMIVSSGTKLNIDYYIEDNVDEGVAEDIYDYFTEAESGSVEAAFAELKEDDISIEEIQLVRLKFLSENAN